MCIDAVPPNSQHFVCVIFVIFVTRSHLILNGFMNINIELISIILQPNTQLFTADATTYLPNNCIQTNLLVCRKNNDTLHKRIAHIANA